MRLSSEMRTSFPYVLIISAIVSLLLVNSAQSYQISNKVDKSVVLQLDEKPHGVNVIVLLKDDTNLKYNVSMNKKERLDLLRTEKRYIFSERIKSIVSTLSNEDFKHHGNFIFKNGFYGTITSAGLEKLDKNPYVAYVHLDSEGTFNLLQSVPVINGTNVLSVKVGSENINGSGETICVIDTGVNYSHSAFGSCNVTGNINDGSCDKVIGGYDFCESQDIFGNCYTDENPMDTYYHGTSVAGMAASCDYNNYPGVAPGAKIVALKAAVYSTPVESATTNAVQWCINNSDTYNISVITLSLSFQALLYPLVPPGPTDTPNCFPERSLSIAINDAIEQGIFVDAASGNNGYTDKISYPSCTNATSVGASYDNYGVPGCVDALCDICNDTTTFVDKIACWGNRDEILDIIAPGSGIISAYINGGWIESHGTSNSAPHVAGAVTLFSQYERLKNNRTLSPSEISERLKDTGKLLFDNTTNLTFPRIDVYSALFPIDVYDFERVSASDTYNVFRFRIKNNYNNKTKDVNWTFDIGNGTIVTSIYDTRLSPGKDVMVFFEENYTDGDIYEVKATGASGTDIDTEEMTLTLGDIITYDLRYVYSNGKHKVFSFKILNNMDSPQLVNWTFYTGTSGEVVSADKLTLLEPGKDVLVFFENEYASFGTYSVRAKGFNVNSTDYTETMTVNAA